MNIENQVIVNKNGHSWLGFHSNNEKLENRLKEICELSQNENYKNGEYANAFWVLDFDGSCVAAQSSLSGALRYYDNNRILVHYQKCFV